MRTRIDGPIMNLCMARGLTEDQAAELLGVVSRVHLTDNLSTKQKVSLLMKMPRMTNLCSELEIMTLEGDSSQYHKARRRIIAMEKALTRLRAGEDHGIRRKKWRKDKDDARSIMDTLVHVISRDPPVTEKDMIADARSLLVRTGELEDYRYTKSAPPTYDGKAGLAVKTTSSEIKLARSETDGIILHDSPCGQLRIQLKNEIPGSSRQKIMALCEEGAPAAQIIDWDGLRGPLAATLQDAREAPYWEGSTCKGERLEIIVDTGWIEKDEDTGIIHVHPPGRTMPYARVA
ncbi:hypothetical protein [uncultured Salinicola sp.]|uniref:hypothetical protein n=1 Tax=uncultured Salinicola sp. TaxID=1193542 RepID=UPI00262D0DDA|nr:hypothetical protein [uncultured Salinicola sp.]|tara:strand:+ start:1749 stop:2618 length:870 start_codon:yes stop_codon:yes gene_type:complete